LALRRRASFATRCLRLGAAGAVSAVVAAAICLLFPYSPTSESLPPHLKPAIYPTVADIDVGAVWREERAHFSDLTSLGPSGGQDNAWMPAGGMSTLLATRFPSAANVRLAEAQPELNAEPNADIPLPPSAPRAGGGVRQHVVRSRPVQIEPQLASLPPQPKPGYFDFFHKLFGDPDKAAKTVLAANPTAALYDITKHVVYLPDGDKLEAHSGYGKSMDDPASVARKDIGVTPPNVYAVTFREKLFHGVRALRMKPIGGGNMYGRDGILAHSYMLGADGESNGCVSVRDYDKFLAAYEAGKFDRIIVMRSADEPPPSQVASAQGEGT
jgi:hypothetical protein